MKEKIQSWGVLWLNIAGRVALIKAMLTVLPIYQYATILAPASIHKRNGINIQGFSMAGKEKGDQKVQLGKMGTSNFVFREGRLIHKATWNDECCPKGQNYMENDNKKGQLVETNFGFKIYESLKNPLAG